MPNYRRAYVHGGTFFFTLKTEHNAPVFNDETAVRLLGTILREAKTQWPFETNAIVVLPDHLHALWTLPSGDANYSSRWAWIKRTFTIRYLQLGGIEQRTSVSRRQNRRRGVWQRRFWEHTIADENDFEAHFDYIHWNPVKHGYVTAPSAWPYSSFHRWVKKGVYPPHWGDSTQPPANTLTLDQCGE